MGLFDRLFRRDSQRTDSYSEHMAPYARRARARQLDSRPGYQPRLTQQELAQLYRNRIVRRIVDMPGNAAANKAPQFSGKDVEFWTNLFTSRSLSIVPANRRGLAWAGLYGFGACLLDFNDRQQLDQPLRPKMASELKAITPISRRVIWPEDSMAGPRSEFFQVWNPQRQIGRVHRSRLLIYDGEDIDEFERLHNMGCGDSRVDQLNGSLSRLFGSHESLAFALQTFSTFLYRVEDLDNMVASDGPKIERKLNAMDEFRHLTRMLTVDAKDQIDYKTMNMTGLPEAIGVLKEVVAAEAGLPQIIVWGTSPSGSGLSNGGLSEMTQFAAYIEQLRTDRLDENYEYLLNVLSEVYRVPVPGWNHHPPLPPDQEKELKNRLAQAQIDGAYTTMGVYGVETVQQRFDGDYTFETKIHPNEKGPKKASERPTEPEFPDEDDDQEVSPDDEKDPAKPVPEAGGK